MTADASLFWRDAFQAAILGFAPRARCSSSRVPPQAKKARMNRSGALRHVQRLRREIGAAEGLEGQGVFGFDIALFFERVLRQLRIAR